MIFFSHQMSERLAQLGCKASLPYYHGIPICKCASKERYNNKPFLAEFCPRESHAFRYVQAFSHNQSLVGEISKRFAKAQREAVEKTLSYIKNGIWREKLLGTFYYRELEILTPEKVLGEG